MEVLQRLGKKQQKRSKSAQNPSTEQSHEKKMMDEQKRLGNIPRQTIRWMVWCETLCSAYLPVVIGNQAESEEFFGRDQRTIQHRKSEDNASSSVVYTSRKKNTSTRRSRGEERTSTGPYGARKKLNGQQHHISVVNSLFFTLSISPQRKYVFKYKIYFRKNTSK